MVAAIARTVRTGESVMPRRLTLTVMVVMAGALAAVAPGSAQSPAPATTASFTAADNSWTVTGTASHAATIAVGGVVSFSYPTGTRHHNADFGNGPVPSSCTQTAGPSSGPVPPLPSTGTLAGWSGTCTFSTPGTYTFFCDVHPYMIGTIDVVAPDSPPPTPTTTTTTTTTPQPVVTPATETVAQPAPPGVPPGTGADTVSPTPAATVRLTLSVPRRQRGARVRGTATLTQPGRLTATLRSADGPAGRLAGRAVSAGAHRFTITLGKAARRTLRRKGHLTVTVTVTVGVPGSAEPTRRTTVVTLSAGR
jgi:plastocyanin